MVNKKIEICLRYIGDPGFLSGVAEDVGANRSTVCDKFWFVTPAISRQAGNWIYLSLNGSDPRKHKDTVAKTIQVPSCHRSN